MIDSVPLPSTDFCLRLARAHAAFVRRFDIALGNHHGISFGDFQVLNHLARADGGRLRRVDLADKLGLSASGVTRTLLPLEKIGLISRQPDPLDARVGFAAVTAVGEEMLVNATVTADLVSRDLLRGVAGTELDGMRTLMARFGAPAVPPAG
ncbi:MarR family winged helix-turn-helix transcriptional regulator [Massilia sp. PWRC2]|uniref:MarR family winged helix-turn-helix transcriptional regulator n=1 Tax=Massilia sp. PWRC2 TaxID=2804626 RepID=UPI003CF333EF